MKKLLPILAIGTILCSCCNSNSSKGNTDFTRINEQAAVEYLQPIRPGYEGRNPFWNKFAQKFIFAPAFDFQKIDGATQYRFTVKPAAEDATQSWSFTSDTPTAPLSPIWNEITVGKVQLKVEALDNTGKVIGMAGEREFRRDYPFTGPYPSARRDYRQAAIMGLLFVHNMPEIQHWATATEPDMNYSHNTYPCKIIGATIRMEVLLAKLLPHYKEEATTIAKNAAQFLIDQSQPEGAPLAFFPPTYYKNLAASKYDWNQGKTMMMEAISAALGFLDLYDLTGEKKYYDHALGIAETYLKHQYADGSLPTKVDYKTGEPVNNARAMLTTYMNFLLRLHRQYGVEKYADALAKAEKWMKETALESFDMTGQFEDVTILGLEPYENLTNCTAAPYASYLLTKDSPSEQEIADAVDLARLCEDQFVYWDMELNNDGIKRFNTPCVIEQYKYKTPVDNSACVVANALLNIYLTTGDKVALAKATALIDNVTVMQNSLNGQIPTTWDYRNTKRDRNRTFWINCSYSSITTLLRMADLIEAGKINK